MVFEGLFLAAWGLAGLSGLITRASSDRGRFNFPRLGCGKQHCVGESDYSRKTAKGGLIAWFVKIGWVLSVGS
jgi:hypothetical protein